MDQPRHTYTFRSLAFRRTGMVAIDLNFADALSIVLVMLTFLLFYLALVETRVIRQEARTVVASYINSEIGRKEVQVARAKVLKEITLDSVAVGKPLPPLPGDLPKEDALMLAVAYDRLAFLVRGSPRLEKEVVEWHREIIEVWSRLGRYVQEEWRKEEGRAHRVMLWQELVERWKDKVKD